MTLPLLILLACASTPPPAPAAVTPIPVVEPLPTEGWAGVPMDQLAALGVVEPTLLRYSSGWEGTFPQGGLLRLELLPNVAAARNSFQEASFTASTRPLPPLALGPSSADLQAVGDGAEMLVLRDQNLVFVVRDPSGHALDAVHRLQGALVPVSGRAAPAVVDRASIEGVTWTWDTYGWRQPAR